METIEVMEPVLFTSISEQLLKKSKVKEIMPILRHIGSEWDLNINKVKHFKVANRILVNSIKWN